MSANPPDKVKKMYRQVFRNAEGLTFWEWFRAANFARRQPMGVTPCYHAWKRGDDPTEYAAI
jgi:hypothetical protein